MSRETGQTVDLKTLRINNMKRANPQGAGAFHGPNVEAESISELSSKLSSAAMENQHLKSENSTLNDRLSIANRTIREANRTVKTKNEEIRRKDREITGLRQARQTSQDVPGDTSGYYKTLGLHPSFAQGLTNAEVRRVIESHKKVYSIVFHPDKGGNLDRMKMINAACDELLKIYGK